MQGQRLSGSGGQGYKRVGIALALALTMVTPVLVWQAAPAGKASAKAPAKATAPADPLLAGFAKAGIGSVADAVDQIVGKRGYLSHDMQSRVGAKTFVGRAATALVKPATPEKSGAGLAAKHSVEMIDEANPGDVGVIVMEGTLDVAAIGNLMATAAKVRGMAGMVLDGAIRDIWDIRRMGLTVYARSATPATAVGHHATVARNVPVQCAGVNVRPGDIIVADDDGVVVVPQERAEEILKKAREIDDRERGMFPFIREHKSLQKAIELFGRI